MVSNQYLIIAILTIIATVLVLRLVLWQLITSSAHLLPRLLSRSTAWPIWVRAAPVRSWLQARHPRTYVFLKARFSPTSFTGLPLTLMCLATLYAVALLGGLIEDLREAEGLVRFDKGMNAFFAPYRAPWLIGVFIWVTALGAGPTITGVMITASALLWSQGQTRVLVPLWITFVGAQGTTWVSKYVLDRTRPPFLDVITATSPSFPSGHATASTALVGLLAYVIARDLPRSRQRFEVVFWAATLIGLICFSRIFLSLHYLSDIAAGVLVGTFWLLVGFTAAELDRTTQK